MKSFIKFFRPVIILGLRTLWFITRPTTSGAKVIVTCGDEILLIKTTYGYSYSLPGGGIKKGETPEEAALRETYEEVGIRLDAVNSLPSFVTFEEFKKDTVYSFYTEVSSKEYTLDALEIDSATWYKIDKLPKVGSVTKKTLDLYFQNRNI